MPVRADRRPRPSTRGRSRRCASTVPLRRRRGGRARDRRAPGRGRRSWPTTGSRLPGAPAARGGGRGGAARAAGGQARRGGRGAARHRASASWPRRSARAPGPGSTSRASTPRPGFTDEECHVFLATDLYDESAEADENERIEIVRSAARRARRRDPRTAATPRRSSACSGCAPRSPDSHVAGQGMSAGAAERRPAMATIEKPVVDEARFERLVLDFLAYLEFERGLSRNTLEAYRTDLLQYGRFLEARGQSALRGRAPRRGRLPRPTSPTGDDDRAPASPATIHRKTRLPALLLPPPAPRGLRDSDPDRDAQRAAPRAGSCRRCSPAARSSAARPAARAPSRPRCATARCSS